MANSAQTINSLTLTAKKSRDATGSQNPVNSALLSEGAESNDESEQEEAVAAGAEHAVSTEGGRGDGSSSDGGTGGGGTSRIHDIANFLTGDPTITDYKLRYISYTAGYGGEDLKNKKWSFTSDCDHQIYIYPDTLNRAFDSNGDFTLKKSYGSLDTILTKMPKVEIRSFQQRTLLQQLVDGIASLIDMCAGSMDDIFSGKILDNAKELFNKVYKKIEEEWKAPGASSDSIFGKIIKGITPDGLHEQHTALLNLPFIFYYCLASSVTRCYFTLPLNVNSYNNLWDSNSRQGWGKGDIGSTAEALKNNLESIHGFGDLGMGPLLGVAFGSMFGASMAPRFHSGAVNTKSDGTEFSLNFTLFNDTAEHARANLSFIRVLIPSAMWSNLGLFAVSGDLYDIKIAGAMRWLMCTGTFEIKPKGAMRKMGMDIRVPDAYEIECSFRSLLPNNLNNYLLGYFTDFEISDRTQVLGKIAQNIKEAFVD